jgi:putative methionine-R-sulfoxide reductase with GAF domain
MAATDTYKKSAVESIKSKVRLVNSLVLLVICVLLFVIIRFLYSFLAFIPSQSLVTLLAITAGLIFLGILVIRNASGSAIKAIEEYSHRLTTLLTTTKRVHEIVHSDTLLNNIMDVSLETTGAGAGSILLLDDGNLVFKVVRGGGSQPLPGTVAPAAEGIAGWVLANGTPVRIDDVKYDSRFSASVDGMNDHDASTLLCVPLRVNSGTIGVLALMNKEGGPFTPEDEEFISYFAEQAAVSIERARFVEDERNYEVHLTNILIEAMEIVPEKKGHSRRVAQYTMLMARVINMTEEERRRLYRASLLHDIGFLKIKTDVISIEEFQKHPRIAFDMLQPVNFYADIAPVILYHHERYDGTGYPTGLKGEAIPLESRMICIAEAFDAIVSGNSYKKVGRIVLQNVPPALSGFQHALDELRTNAGTQFDAELVDIFVNNISEEYVDLT